jgi:hypothetical protein
MRTGIGNGERDMNVLNPSNAVYMHLIVSTKTNSDDCCLMCCCAPACAGGVAVGAA